MEHFPKVGKYSSARCDRIDSIKQHQHSNNVKFTDIFKSEQNAYSDYCEREQFIHQDVTNASRQYNPQSDKENTAAPEDRSSSSHAHNNGNATDAEAGIRRYTAFLTAAEKEVKHEEIQYEAYHRHPSPRSPRKNNFDTEENTATTTTTTTTTNGIDQNRHDISIPILPTKAETSRPERDSVEVHHQQTLSKAKASTKESILCQVCGDTAAGYYCSAYTCEACKKFFIRSTKQENPRYACQHNERCEITKANRTLCQYCRYQKCLKINMSYQGKAKYPGKAGIQKIPCRVCSAPSSGFHFGAITCEGCKGFFRRKAKEDDSSKYKCNAQGNCEINNLINKSSCKACRYKKCLSVGMSVNASRIGRQPNAMKHAISLEADKQVANGNGQEQDKECESQATTETQHDPSLLSLTPEQHQQPSEGNSRTFNKDSNFNSEEDNSSHRKNLSSCNVLEKSECGFSSSPEIKEPDFCQGNWLEPAIDLTLLKVNSDNVSRSSGFNSKGSNQENYNLVSKQTSYVDLKYSEPSQSPLTNYSHGHTTAKQTNSYPGYPYYRFDCKKSFCHPKSILQSCYDYDPCYANEFVHSDPENGSPVEFSSRQKYTVDHSNGSSPEDYEFRQVNSAFLNNMTPSPSSTSTTMTPSPQQNEYSDRDLPYSPQVNNGLHLQSDFTTAKSSSQCTGNNTYYENSIPMLQNGGSGMFRPQNESRRQNVPVSTHDAMSHHQHPQKISHDYHLQKKKERNDELIDYTNPKHNCLKRSDEESLSNASHQGRENLPSATSSTDNVEHQPGSHKTLLQQSYSQDYISSVFKHASKELSHMSMVERAKSGVYDEESYSTIDSAWTRMMKHFEFHTKCIVRFVKKIPGFREISIEDQISLLQKSMYPLLVLNQGRTYEPKTGFVNYFNFTNKEGMRVHELFPELVILHTHFLQSGHMAWHLQLTDIDYAFLSCLLILTNDTDDILDSKKVKKLKEFYTESLRVHVLECSSNDEIRYSEMLLRLPDFWHFSLQHNDAVEQILKKHQQLHIPHLYAEMYCVSSE